MKTFVNNQKYPVSVTSESGGLVSLQPGCKIEGDWYERFLGMKQLSRYMPPNAQSIASAEARTKASATPRFRGKTGPDLIKEIKEASVEKLMREYSKGQLIGLVEFLKLPIPDGDHSYLARSLKASV